MGRVAGAGIHREKHRGRRTANGEPFNGSSLTAAHRTLPFGTKLRVTYRGKSATVRVNDRGPFLHGRVIDLSYAAAYRVGIAAQGSGEVIVEAILAVGA